MTAESQPSATPDGSAEVAEATRQALMYARDLARLQALRRQYERLLPQGLDLDAAPPAPVVREATAMFTDIRGFTGLAEAMADDPVSLLGVVNEHFAAVVRAITRAGGVVEKFVGDGVMATFGARGDQADHAQRALAAGMGVVGATFALNRRRAKAWGFELHVGVGLATGRLVVGVVGPPERSELGVLGDPVNVAARLVAAAGAGEVLLTANVYGALGGLVQAEMLGESAVRGRTGKVETYRVTLGRRSTR